MKIPGLFQYDIVSAREGSFLRYEPDLVITLINQGFFLLSVLLVWGSPDACYGIVAFLTAAVMLGSELLWKFSVSGQWVMLGLLWMTLLATVLYELDRGFHRTAP